MRRERALLTGFALALGLLAGACANSSDVLDKIQDSVSDFNPFGTNKKPLPGERRPVFPNGVPGVEQGIPPELMHRDAAAVDPNAPQLEAAPAPAAPQQITAREPKPKRHVRTKPKKPKQPKQEQARRAPPSRTPASDPPEDAVWPPPPSQQQSQPATQWPAQGSAPQAAWPNTAPPAPDPWPGAATPSR